MTSALNEVSRSEGIYGRFEISLEIIDSQRKIGTVSDWWDGISAKNFENKEASMRYNPNMCLQSFFQIILLISSHSIRNCYYLPRGIGRLFLLFIVRADSIEVKPWPG